MKGYDYSTWGERVAPVYDESFEGVFAETGATVDFLAPLATDKRALELAIGTGRVALPLTERDISVHGIDSSEAMVAELVKKPGGQSIPVTMGNFADVQVKGSFSLIFIVFNTLFALLSQEEQVRCFANVAEHLTEDGTFVIEVFVPDPARFDRGQRVHSEGVAIDEVNLSVMHHDSVNQRVEGHRVVLSKSGTKLYPVCVRYSWPSELDLMAKLAGLSIRERWSGWRREPFTSESVRHISVYERASAAYL